MVVKGSVTEEWFSGVLRSFLGWVLAKVRRKRGGGSPRDVGQKKVCKREVLQSCFAFRSFRGFARLFQFLRGEQLKASKKWFKI